MLTDRGKLLAAGALGLWLTSRALDVPEAAMAAVAVLALLGIAVFYTRSTSARLATRRIVRPTRLFHDAEGRVELELRNEGRFPTASLVVRDEAPSAIAEQTRFVLGPLRPHRHTSVTYGLQGRRRGRFTIGPASVELRDPFGIARRPVRFGRTDEVVVYPPVWALPDLLPRGGRKGTTSEGTTRPFAPSGEFATVREYVRGDDLRKVHWRSTAHRGELMVKQEEAPRDAQATVVLDLRRDVHQGVGDMSTFEHAVTATASGAYHLADRRYRLRLVTAPFQHPPESIPWELLLDQLADIEPGPGRTLQPIWQQLAKGAGGDGLLLAVVAVPDAADLQEMVRAGRAFGSRVAVLVAPGGLRGARETHSDAVDALRVAGWRATVARPGERLDESWRALALRGERARPVMPAGAAGAAGRAAR
ncbi:MAG: DUF58 domain-containing protein [Nitriliruptorales bacterium]